MTDDMDIECTEDEIIYLNGRNAELFEEATVFFESQVSRKIQEIARENWGFDPSILKKYRIGYAPPTAQALEIHLRTNGFSQADLLDSGLFTSVEMHDEPGMYTVYPLFRGRIMFPYTQNGKVAYFIGRSTPMTPGYWGESKRAVPKYLKQKRTSLITEPIYGIDSVVSGETLIITEGIADCISAQNAGYACISPVTTQLKGELIEQTAAICRTCSKAYIVNDSEDNSAGLKGAISQGLRLHELGVSVFICSIPRPEDIEKIDLTDYLRNGERIEDLLVIAIPIMEHPEAKKRVSATKQQGSGKTPRESGRKTGTRSGYATSAYNSSGQAGQQSTGLSPSKDEWIHDFYPSLIALIKQHVSLFDFVEGTGHMSHPIYGSKTGTNLHVEIKDGEPCWYCFHRGNEGGGDLIKWVAVYELDLISEGETLAPKQFKDTVRYLVDTYVPGTSFARLKKDYIDEWWRKQIRGQNDSASSHAEQSEGCADRLNVQNDMPAQQTAHASSLPNKAASVAALWNYPPFWKFVEQLVEAHTDLPRIVGFQGVGQHPYPAADNSTRSLSVTQDDTGKWKWKTTRSGDRKPCSGDQYKWVAVYELHFIEENERLSGNNRKFTLIHMLKNYTDMPLDDAIEYCTEIYFSKKNNTASGEMDW